MLSAFRVVVAEVLALVSCGNSVSEGAGRTPDQSRWHTELPTDIESEIASSLNLEFGAPRFSEPLEPSDLSYIGEFVVNGIPTKYWSFPCSSEPGCWAYASPWDDSYTLDWGGGTPPPDAQQRASSEPAISTPPRQEPVAPPQ